MSKSTSTAGLAGAPSLAGTALLASFFPNGIATNECGCIITCIPSRLWQERSEVARIHLASGLRADVQEELDVCRVRLVHLLRRGRTHAGEPQEIKPLPAQVDVVAGVKEAAAEIGGERNRGAGQPIRQRALVAAF